MLTLSYSRVLFLSSPFLSLPFSCAPAIYLFVLINFPWFRDSNYMLKCRPPESIELLSVGPSFMERFCVWFDIINLWTSVINGTSMSITVLIGRMIPCDTQHTHFTFAMNQVRLKTQSTAWKFNRILTMWRLFILPSVKHAVVQLQVKCENLHWIGK